MLWLSIEVGEELVTNYVDQAAIVYSDSDTRQAVLQQGWGFLCGCQVCTIYTLSTQPLHTIYTVSTHYLHIIYALSTQHSVSIKGCHRGEQEAVLLCGVTVKDADNTLVAELCNNLVEEYQC